MRLIKQHQTSLILSGLLLLASGGLMLPASAQTSDNGAPTVVDSPAETPTADSSNADTPGTVTSSGILTSSRRIAAGTLVRVKLLRDVNSATAQPGDRIRVQVAPGDASGLPLGAIFVGRLTAAKAATVGQAGLLRMQFGADNPNAAEGGLIASSLTRMATAQLTGVAPTSDKSQMTGAGAGLGAIIGFTRKRKLGDAIGGAILGGAAGAGANALQKHPGSDVNLKSGSLISLKLDRPLVVQTQISVPY